MATQVLPSTILHDTDETSAAPTRKPSIARRLFDAFTQSQMRRAQREIAHAMQLRGMHVTPPQD